jgi:hypothetical protein
MWYPAELVIKNYKPDQLEKGMLFLNILHPGTFKETFEVFSLDRIPRDEDAFIAINGFPIEFSIIIEEEELINHSEIGWFDFGEKADFLSQISLKEINIILNEFQGWLEIMIDEDAYEEEDLIQPLMEEEKVILRFFQEEEE